ncbi:nitric oxide-associated protein 1 [Pygocentrus nattereri]|uniref:G domain-containing protein n=1 Tax=Pygocentrus nattereri TaxID=42514 RepID=A0A3B4DQN6_PYGNA|nr:nitric oxide-associated protein 1 [Pygocentrus nattereri]
MFKLLQVPALRVSSWNCLKHASMCKELEKRRLCHLYFGFLCEGSVSPHRVKALRSHSSAASSIGFEREERAQIVASAQPQAKAASETHCSVEPDREEEFTFLEFSEPLDQEHLPEHLLVTESMKVKEDKVPKVTSSELRQRALELQLRALKDVASEEVDGEPCIEFHDVDFPLDKSSRKKKVKKEHKVYGTPDSEVPVSDTCCSGCGALMHCTVPEAPGYLPSEKFKQLVEEDKLKRAVCQRCFLLVHHQKALNVTVPKEEYWKIFGRIKSEKALVLLIVDLLDLPDSIIPNLPQLVGKNKHIVILGNKVDLLPGDAENYLQRIKRQLAQYCAEAGIPTSDHKDIHLISAKTGYGIENLITRLQTGWKYKGDVYLVGTANAGKSTLFNTLLESDYCKSRASDVIHKATISPWPGTTLNLLKFPIINPTPYRLFRRAERLQQAAQETEEDLNPEELKRIKQFSRQGYLVGRIGRTFRADQFSRKNLVEFDPDSLSFGEDLQKDSFGKPDPEPVEDGGLSYNEIKDAHWFYDTPGIMKEYDVLSLLNEQEVKMVVPTQAITPRTFILKPGMVLFLGALARIDYLEGNHQCWFTVVASSRIPVHITSLDKADAIYQKHAGSTLLAVPMGGEKRMKEFLPLVAQDFELHGQGIGTAVTDIKLSSAGWVAVTASQGERLLLRTHAPEAAGLCLRNPPLLPHIVNVKGDRILKTPAYKTKKPQALGDKCLPARAERKRK